MVTFARIEGCAFPCIQGERINVIDIGAYLPGLARGWSSLPTTGGLWAINLMVSTGFLGWKRGVLPGVYLQGLTIRILDEY